MSKLISRLIKKSSKKIGVPPGTIEFIGEKKVETVKIKIIDYNEKKLQEKTVDKIEECFSYKETPSVSWINIDGIHDTEIIKKIGDCYNIHPLVLEDIANTTQRPKFEDFDDYIFLIIKMLFYNDQTNEIKSEQVSLILGPNYVMSFQETEGDIFDPVRERIRSGKGRIRNMKADYLCYALLDVLVDNYFTILEKVGERIESMEAELVVEPTQKTLQDIYHLKREMIILRKSVWPLREVVNSLDRSESDIIKKSTFIYLRDVYDHTIQVIDTIETFRDMLSGLLDLYLSSISNKMNQIMKVLTIIATIFIPLTFIAGIYGMNFDPGASPFNMPELGWYWGYLFVWAIMLILIILMIAYFKFKKWL